MKKIKKGMQIIDFTFHTPWLKNQVFSHYLKRKRKTILVFMRFYGCRLCQLDINKMIKSYSEFQKRNTQILIVLQTEPSIIRNQHNKSETPLTFICDPNHFLYRLYGLETYNYKDKPKEVKEKLQLAIDKGYEKVDNNNKEIPNQLPATFIMNSNWDIEFAYYGVHTGDVPSIEKLIEKIDH